MNNLFIYSLLCPQTGVPRYVGKSKTPASRLSQHLAKAGACKTHRDCWITGLRIEGLRPVLEVLDSAEAEDIDFWERYYISLYNSWGFDLTNRTAGGDGNTNPSLAVREKIAASLRGHKHSDEERAKRTASVIKAWQNPSLREAARLRAVERIKAGTLPRGAAPGTNAGRPWNGDRKRMSEKISQLRQRPDVEPHAVIDLYNQGKSQNEIASLLHCNRKTVQYRMKEAGLKTRDRSIGLAKETLQESYINCGNTVAQIAKQYGHSTAVIEKYLRRYGLRKYKSHDHFAEGT